MCELSELQKKVERRISEYIGFDVREILELDDYISIYGGAVRDSIADLEIHDVDIMCLPQSANKLRIFLQEKYDYLPIDLHKKGTLDLYKDITVIAEPWTFLSKDRNIVQIIRPRHGGSYRRSSNLMASYDTTFYELIKNVDLSNCGVFLDNSSGVIRLKEACKDGIVHCLTNTFVINDWSQLYNVNRTTIRANKLTSRGWKDLNQVNYGFFVDNKEIKRKEREVKIKKIEFSPEYDYKIWTGKEHMPKVTKVSEDDVFEDLDFL